MVQMPTIARHAHQAFTVLELVLTQLRVLARKVTTAHLEVYLLTILRVKQGTNVQHSQTNQPNVILDPIKVNLVKAIATAARQGRFVHLVAQS